MIVVPPLLPITTNTSGTAWDSKLVSLCSTLACAYNCVHAFNRIFTILTISSSSLFLSANYVLGTETFSHMISFNLQRSFMRWEPLTHQLSFKETLEAWTNEITGPKFNRAGGSSSCAHAPLSLPRTRASTGWRGSQCSLCRAPSPANPGTPPLLGELRVFPIPAKTLTSKVST